jgi:predicted ATP-dependent serine protease
MALWTYIDQVHDFPSLYDAASRIAVMVRSGKIAKQSAVDRLYQTVVVRSLNRSEDDIQAILSSAFRLVEDQTEKSELLPTKRHNSIKTLRGQELIVRCASDITPESVTWVWPGRLALGKLTVIAGDPGLGKSQILVSIAATISTGGHWPCQEGTSPTGSVVILSAEDGDADTIVPRLMAAGADLSRVHIVSSVRDVHKASRRTFNLATDLELLEQKIDELGDVAAVEIDPISAYMGKADSHNNSEVRGVLEPLAELATRRRLAVLVNTHINKSNGGRAIHRFIGSIGFVVT